ncbi:DUF4349 domain-containing protein [Spirulina major CS-329]|uniref:DUF4349 domain-containing protein n=1 Tax=Spirulina TaxID=1154 RepID=UPI00232EDA5F|nr:MULTISPECIES: DUF4349 domain-containing protein [Spirulina]MDB9494199.1 DUF4349 domain-containing protein [Spirulina subsalsa CS-330]MDB9504794.1 DUF4349 domain-containing protein [Spirulina major CS-329]
MRSASRPLIRSLQSLTLTGVSLLALASCGAAPSLESNVAGDVALEQTESASAPPNAASVEGEPAPTATLPQLIKRAEVTLAVDSLGTALDELTALVRQRQGDVLTLELNEGDRRSPQAFLQVRIPQAELERTIEDLQAIGTIRQQRITAEDVSNQLVDLEARLRNLRRTETSLLEIMERSGSMADVLTVAKEVSAVRQQIEQIDAQASHLRNQVAFSTLTMTLETTAIAPSTRPPLSSQLGTTWQQASDSLQGVTLGFLRLGVWLLVYSPYWLGIGAIAWAVRRRQGAIAPPITTDSDAPLN